MDCNKVNIKKGSKGDNVKEAQTLLNKYGYYEGLVDGIFGDYTDKSVKTFQKDAKLTVDGVIGSVTCGKLNSLQKINFEFKKGSTGIYVFIVQRKLKQLNYYTANVDGVFGDVTVQSVKNYQRDNNLVVDAVVGSITYNSVLNNNKSKSTGVYTNNTLCERSGGDCQGQITAYHCAPHCIKQGVRKFGITRYSEATIGGYAGTTSAGTGHLGIETALAKIAKNEGIKLKVEWKNLSDLGSTITEQYKALGEILNSEDKFVFIHLLYRDKDGHYEHIKTVNINNNQLVISNSLGSRCNYPAYCGYNENRPIITENRYIRGISQKSICIVTKL